MSDLVEELRSGHRIGMHQRLCRAADEIERLRKALSAIHQISEDYPANDSQLDRIQDITERVLNLSSGQ